MDLFGSLKIVLYPSRINRSQICSCAPRVIKSELYLLKSNVLKSNVSGTGRVVDWTLCDNTSNF